MIDVSNLRYKYKSNKDDTLKGLNFKIPEGEIFGFLGPSGAGKTTTQKLITGLLKGYSGCIKINGKGRESWDNSFYEMIGVVFEFPNLYLKLTGAENLRLFASYYKKKSMDMSSELKRIGIHDVIDKKVQEYSKGMKVRLNFIRALQHDPQIFFFDEPVSGLDPSYGAIVKEMIRELKDKGKTVFLTTHNMTVAEELCDRVAFIVDGSLPLIENTSELMVSNGKNEVEVEYVDDGGITRMSFCLDKLGEDREFIKLINKYKIRSIHSKEASLEEIFIKITGRGLG